MDTLTLKAFIKINITLVYVCLLSWWMCVLVYAGDDVNVIGKQGLMEKMIVRRFFSRKHGLPDMANWMTNQVCV